MSSDAVEALLTYLARALVDRPDDVSLRGSEVDGGRLLELKVAPDDIGKVIGRDGRTVNALRTLVNASASAQGQKIRLEILDDRRAAPAPAAAPAPEAP